jgi:hypothetical protein
MASQIFWTPSAPIGPIDRRFPKRHPEIEAMYPGHLRFASRQRADYVLRPEPGAAANQKDYAELSKSRSAFASSYVTTDAQ